jgi:hypothetical protein
MLEGGRLSMQFPLDDERISIFLDLGTRLRMESSWPGAHGEIRSSAEFTRNLVD